MIFPATLLSLSPLAHWLTQQMATLPASEEWRFSLDLAACETATNIIRHALHEDSQRYFNVEFIAAGRRVTLRFTDAGDTFPQERLAAAHNNAFTDNALLSENGRGLKLILLYVDTFKVERCAGENITTLEKFLSEF